MNVLQIAVKDIRVTAILTGGLALLFVGLYLLASYIPPVVVIFIAVALSGIYVITTLLSVERYEDRNNGYLFLLRMPLRPVEVAAGKLLPTYLLNLIACGLAVLLAGLLGQDPQTTRFFQSIAIMAGCLWLFVAALAYTGICVLGFTKFSLVFRISMIALVAGLQAVGVVALRARADLPGMTRGMVEACTGAPWLLVCILVTAAYFAFIGAGGKLVRLHGTR